MAMATCLKIRYETQLSAWLALLLLQWKASHGHTDRHEKAVYQCHRCEGWHLTSQDREQRAHHA